MSDLVFTQEEAQRLKALLFQVQNAAIDLAKENNALQSKLEAVKRLARAKNVPSPFDKDTIRFALYEVALIDCIALGIDPKEL